MSEHERNLTPDEHIQRLTAELSRLQTALGEAREIHKGALSTAMAMYEAECTRHDGTKTALAASRRGLVNIYAFLKGEECSEETALGQATAAVSSLTAALARAEEQQRETARTSLWWQHECHTKQNQRDEARQLAHARGEALRPFAAYADALDASSCRMRDEEACCVINLGARHVAITWGDCRRAQALLTRPSPADRVGARLAAAEKLKQALERTMGAIVGLRAWLYHPEALAESERPLVIEWRNESARAEIEAREALAAYEATAPAAAREEKL